MTTYNTTVSLRAAGFMYCLPVSPHGRVIVPSLSARSLNPWAVPRGSPRRVDPEED
jgi:hypothetical protein